MNKKNLLKQVKIFLKNSRIIAPFAINYYIYLNKNVKIIKKTAFILKALKMAIKMHLLPLQEKT